MNRDFLISSLLAEYARERKTAVDAADAYRTKIIAQKAPIYADFEAQLRRAIRDSMMNIGSDPEAGRKAIYALKQEADDQLKAAGYTLDDLRPKFKCEKCEDTGFVGMPIKHFCECFTRRLNLLQLSDEYLGIPENHCFERFDLSTFPVEATSGVEQRKMMQNARNWAEKYADNFSEKEQRSILISGESGLGKTFLLDCITKRIVERGFSAMKLSAYRMTELMREKHFHRNDSGAKFDLCLGVDYLAIDDLGSEPMLENVTIEYLYILISERQRSGKPFIIATNLTLNQLKARYTERLFSRIASKENPVVILKGEDVRLSR